MALRSLQLVLRRLHGLASGEGVTDALLLERFVRQRDEAAFELLVRRHERLVLGVCRRVLHNAQDAEDAFQATFLVLVRKAGSIGRWESLAGWLYRVAYRISLRANATARRRHQRETSSPTAAEAEAPHEPDEALWRDLRPVLDQEINALPQRYRGPVILCYLEGKSYDEAAAQLGCPKGTLSTRLTRARELLRDRLTRRGLALTSAALAACLAGQAAQATAAQTLVSNTVRAAAGLTVGAKTGGEVVSTQAIHWMEGVMKDMLYTKMKIAGIVAVALVLLGTGVGVWGQGVLALADPEKNKEQAQVKELPGKKQASDLERLQGTWWLEPDEARGKPVPKEGAKKADTMTINGDQMIEPAGDFEITTTFRIDPNKSPKTIDLLSVAREDFNGVLKERITILQRGIYELRGDTLKICLAPGEKERPKRIQAPAQAGHALQFYRRIDPSQVRAQIIPASPGFTRAEIALNPDDPGKPPKKFKAIIDRVVVAKLAGFFPGVGTGRESPIAGGWIPVASIKFVRQDGKAPVTVNIAPGFDLWSEGPGDWKTKPGLQAFIEQLTNPPAAATPQVWSRPMNGLRGRLVLRSRFVDNGTERLELAVELENIGSSPLIIENDPVQLMLTILDASGQPVPAGEFPRTGTPLPRYQKGTVPAGAYLGIPVGSKVSGTLHKFNGAQLSLYKGDWALKPGRYTLKATFSYITGKILVEPINQESPRQWAGHLELPTLDVEVFPRKEEK
jgi:RNA polymerase sigma factor (sigma-70 family)